MRVLSALLPLALASTAYAQAPGEYAPAPPPAPYTIQPPYDSLMANRLSVGLNLGESSVTSAIDNNSTNFGIAELTVGYRARPEWSIELTLGGGNQKLDDGTDGNLSMASGTLSLKYHINPYSHLSEFIGIGLGATAIADKHATSDQVDAATRGHAQLSGGLEYRWTNFALQAELRLTAMGQPKGYDNTYTSAPQFPNGQPLADASSTDDTMTAAQLTIGASYYF